MNSSSSGSVLAIGLVATMIFGLGLATFVTQNVIAQGDDDRSGAFDLKDWCGIDRNGDMLTVRSEGVSLAIDIRDARGNGGRGAGLPFSGPFVGVSEEPIPLGHLIRVKGVVREGLWSADLVTVERQSCDPAPRGAVDRRDGNQGILGGNPGSDQGGIQGRVGGQGGGR